jgi:hypothetical protein
MARDVVLTAAGTFVGVLIGGLITWLVSWIYYTKASRDLLDEAEKLRKRTDILGRVLINSQQCPLWGTRQTWR